MTLSPGYGETPHDPEEADALTAQARALLGDDPTKADLYEAEQAILAEVSEDLLDAVADGALGLDEIVSDHFLDCSHPSVHRRQRQDHSAACGSHLPRGARQRIA